MRVIGTFSAVDRFKDGDEGRKRRMRRMDVPWRIVLVLVLTW